MKQFKQRTTIFTKIIVLFIVLIISMISISTYVSIHYESKVAKESIISTGKYISEFIASSTENAFYSLNWIFVNKMLHDTVRFMDEQLVYALLVRENGKIYMASDDAYKNEYFDTEIFKTGITIIDNYEFHKEHDHGILMAKVLQIGKNKFYVILGLSIDPIHQKNRVIITRNIYIGALFLIVGLLFSFLVSRNISGPITKLANAVKEISSSNIVLNVETGSNDEVGVLENRFKIMLDNLRITQSDLKLSAQELEIRVEERTAELHREVEERIVAEEKYRKLMEASPVPIVVYDMIGTTIYINPAFIQAFGWTLEEMQEGKINYVPKEELPQTLEMIEIIKQGEGFHGFETRRYNKKKELLDVSISFGVWRGQDGVPKGSVVILHDITKRKQLEVQLFQSRKMEAMGTLAGGIAHDFNNILSGIFSYSQLAERHIENSEKAKRHISQILKGAQRAAELVQQILTFSRKTEYQKQSLSLYIVVEEVLKLLRSSIPTTIEIKENIASRAMVLAEPTHMHQVIMNLCTNAYHAMRKKGGVLTVALNEIEISEHNMDDTNLIPGKYLKLEVKDTGHGMDKKTLEKAFDLYFTTKKVGKGTGFGLALVQAIVEEHDGYVKAHSVPGQGASFYVYLPMVGQKIDPHTLEQGEEPLIGGSEKIMVVDDDESIRMATREFLEDCGYRVSSFQNGVQAFQEFKKDPYQFDLIITDMNMPQMAGDELSDKILKIRKNLPIILCTGYSENITEVKAIEIGITKYVQKPVWNQKLAFLIREVLDKK